jgi:hypothetical protein
MSDEVEENLYARRGIRCGFCYWALYDGDWCQNPDCKTYGQRMWGNTVSLTTQEAMILINAKSAEIPKFDTAKGDELHDEVQHCNRCGKQKTLSGICEHHLVCEECDKINPNH